MCIYYGTYIIVTGEYNFVIADCFMEPKSSTDTSALFQLKNLIHLSSFGKEPTEDFLEVVLIAHVTTAAKDLQASSNCSGQSALTWLSS